VAKDKLEAVRSKLKASGVEIAHEERNRDDHGTQLRLDGLDGVVNVFDTGTCQVQGRDKAAIEIALGDLVGRGGGRRRPAGGGDGAVTDRLQTNDVFVVYGRDRTARTELEALLRRVGLEPLILDQLPTEGATVIEQLEKYQQDVPGAIVLTTPDDEGYIRGEPDKVRPRARQNVVLELGMVLVKCSRDRVVVLLKDAANMEKPSDIDGLLYKGFTNSVEEVKVELMKELDRFGYEINWKKI